MDIDALTTINRPASGGGVNLDLFDEFIEHGVGKLGDIPISVYKSKKTIEVGFLGRCGLQRGLKLANSLFKAILLIVVL